MQATTVQRLPPTIKTKPPFPSAVFWKPPAWPAELLAQRAHATLRAPEPMLYNVAGATSCEASQCLVWPRKLQQLFVLLLLLLMLQWDGIDITMTMMR